VCAQRYRHVTPASIRRCRPCFRVRVDPPSLLANHNFLARPRGTSPLPAMMSSMKARLEKPVLDCPDPQSLSRFYAELLGMRAFEDSAEWVVIGREPGMRELAFQKSDPWTPPTWPDPRHPMLHLDIRVDDLDAAEAIVLAAGATHAPGTPETGYRVFRDPVGYPFCLTFGPSRRQDPRMDFSTTQRPT
jgi:catechol 2,3-dioxygenase-like lactoylglutathione lyase family enzyme